MQLANVGRAQSGAHCSRDNHGAHALFSGEKSRRQFDSIATSNALPRALFARVIICGTVCGTRAAACWLERPGCVCVFWSALCARRRVVRRSAQCRSRLQSKRTLRSRRQRQDAEYGWRKINFFRVNDHPTSC